MIDSSGGNRKADKICCLERPCVPSIRVVNATLALAGETIIFPSTSSNIDYEKEDKIINIEKTKIILISLEIDQC